MYPSFIRTVRDSLCCDSTPYISNLKCAEIAPCHPGYISAPLCWDSTTRTCFFLNHIFQGTQVSKARLGQQPWAPRLNFLSVGDPAWNTPRCSKQMLGSCHSLENVSAPQMTGLWYLYNLVSMLAQHLNNRNKTCYHSMVNSWHGPDAIAAS